MLRKFWAAILLSVSLLQTGCIETNELYAVRQPAHRPEPDTDDHPRVDLAYETVKPSFKAAVIAYCEDPKDGLHATVNDETKMAWKDRQPRANDCVIRIAAYAADQCTILTLHQNEWSQTANLLTGIAVIGSALVTDGYAISGHASDKTSTAALATAVATNSSGVKGYFPANANPPIDKMIPLAATYAEAVALKDNDFPSPSGPPSDATVMKLARLHDAVFSACTANAYGLHGKRRGTK